jgi:hypothetical protein
MQNYFHKRLDFVVYLSYIKYAVQLGSKCHHTRAIQNIRIKAYISQALSQLCDIRHTFRELNTTLCINSTVIEYNGPKVKNNSEKA